MQGADELLSETGRGVLGAGPARGCEEFLSSGTKASQILEVLAPRPLVHRGVELEADLVLSTGQMQDKTTEDTRVDSFQDVRWQAKVEEGRGSDVQPRFGDPEHERGVHDRALEGRRKRLDLANPAVLHEPNDVDILRWSLDEPEEQERPTADGEDFVPKPPLGEELAQGVECSFEVDRLLHGRACYMLDSRK